MIRFECGVIARTPGFLMTADRPRPANRRLTNAARASRARGPLPDAASEKTAIVSIITESLEEEIVLGRRHPRERLIEQELCDRFKTHRADVRMALFELERKGLIQRIPN